MNNYLIDEEVLAEFADNLLKQKFPNQTAGENAPLREKITKELDDKITKELFGSLSEEQLAELNQILDNENASEIEFQSFFEGVNIDVEHIMMTTMTNYQKQFLTGGENESK